MQVPNRDLKQREENGMFLDYANQMLMLLSPESTRKLVIEPTHNGMALEKNVFHKQGIIYQSPHRRGKQLAKKSVSSLQGSRDDNTVAKRDVPTQYPGKVTGATKLQPSTYLDTNVVHSGLNSRNRQVGKYESDINGSTTASQSPLGSTQSSRINRPRPDLKRLNDNVELKLGKGVKLIHILNKSLSEIWKLWLPNLNSTEISNNPEKASQVLPHSIKSNAGKQQVMPSTLTPFEYRKRRKANEKMYTESDRRPSAIGLGSFGALVLVVIATGIVILDSNSLYKDFRRLKRRIYKACSPTYRHRVTVSPMDGDGERWAFAIHGQQASAEIG